jgi:nucleoside-diphosphate-sugar epimerase
MTSRSVSITGATGFLGWHLAHAFRDSGWNVRSIVRPGTPKPQPPGTERVEAALEADGLTRAIDGTDLLIHNAAVIRARRASTFETVNVEGTAAAIAAANAAGARLIFISSQAAAGPGTPARPTSERDSPKPVGAYGLSKLAAEKLIRSTAIVPWTIVRPCAVYGPRDRGFLPLFQYASRGVFLLVTKPTAAFTLVHVDDLTRAIVLAATSQRAAGETFFIGHPSPHTMPDAFQSLAEIFGRPYVPRRVPPMVLRALGWAGELAWMFKIEPPVDRLRVEQFGAEGFVCSVDRAREVLGFTAALDWPEGAARTAQWYRDQGWV